MGDEAGDGEGGDIHETMVGQLHIWLLFHLKKDFLLQAISALPISILPTNDHLIQNNTSCDYLEPDTHEAGGAASRRLRKSFLIVTWL